ncbi:bile acid:sodium symporter family protein [uncultured Pseudoalteromonas sp.]|uniref:bile acid:sodium symporter family protein n=2 Tax=Pseudoalteromonas TaxID=53246 RepID=UPI0025FDF7DC|nr:bile acid:sodium symporter family protein [uncultured Pseudoalteromonas sp.]|tara:strand:+ start:20070 stop:20987 length:918 start_codon:yes stop_codon:yes gene_type:complete
MMSQASLITLNLILAMMMFGIALSLKLADFKRVLKAPRGPITGLLAQFILLPLITWLLTLMVPMPAEVALGLILVSSCPGGSFSNIVTFLAKGNTAMSVSMTGVASLAATVMTPFNFMLYSSLNSDTAVLLTQINVPASNILVIVALVLALPLSLGLLAAKLWPVFAARSEPFFRFISLLTLFLFVLIALTSNWSAFIAGASIFLLAVIVHNAIALLVGFSSARIMKLNKADTRAITLEVGLQNSGLGLGIIFTFFDNLTGMAIIAAAWGCWHLISGMGLCFYWQHHDRKHGIKIASNKEVQCGS